MQARDYPARLARLLVSGFATEGVIDKAADGFEVTERALGPNFTVDVAAGYAVIDGDDEPDQGSYLVRSTAVESVTIDPAPVTANTSRIDLVILRIKDPTAGGPAGDLAELDVVSGVEAVAPAVAAVPATPDSTIVLARVAVTNLSASIANAAITDVRPQSRPLPEVDLSAHLTTAAAAGIYVTTAAAIAAFIPKSLADAAGDLAVATANDTWGKLAHPGVVGKVLKSAAAGALSWEDDATGGGGGAWPAAVGARVYRAAALNHASHGSEVAVAFDTETFDAGGFWDAGSPTRLTVPAGEAGKYVAVASVYFADNATGGRYMGIRKNGSMTAISTIRPAGAGDAAMQVSDVMTLAVGDYVESFGWQASGGALAYTVGAPRVFLALVKVGT